MRYFVCNDLEPLAYLVYMAVLYLQYRRSKQIQYKVLCLFYATAALLLYAGIVVESILNSWSYNALFLINICVFSWYFQSIIINPATKKIIALCCFINVALLIYSDLKGDFLGDFNGYYYGVSFITIVLYALFYFHQMLENMTDKTPWQSFDFWLISGYLLYFLGSFFIVIFYENVDVMQRANIWGIQNCILFICAISMLGIYFKTRQKEEQYV